MAGLSSFEPGGYAHDADRAPAHFQPYDEDFGTRDLALHDSRSGDGGRVTYMQFMEDTFATASSFDGAEAVFRADPEGGDGPMKGMRR